MDAQQATENFFKGMTTLIGIIAGLSLAAFLLLWIIAARRR